MLSLEPHCPERRRDREFKVCQRLTGRAAQRLCTPGSCAAAWGRSSSSADRTADVRPAPGVDKRRRPLTALEDEPLRSAVGPMAPVLSNRLFVRPVSGRSDARNWPTAGAGERPAWSHSPGCRPGRGDLSANSTTPAGPPQRQAGGAAASKLRPRPLPQRAAAGHAVSLPRAPGLRPGPTPRPPSSCVARVPPSKPRPRPCAVPAPASPAPAAPVRERARCPRR